MEVIENLADDGGLYGRLVSCDNVWILTSFEHALLLGSLLIRNQANNSIVDDFGAAAVPATVNVLANCWLRSARGR